MSTIYISSTFQDYLVTLVKHMCLIIAIFPDALEVKPMLCCCYTSSPIKVSETPRVLLKHL